MTMAVPSIDTAAVKTRAVDCLDNGSPLATDVERLLAAVAQADAASGGGFVRCYVAFEVLQRAKELFARDFALEEFSAVLRDAAALATRMLATQRTYAARLADPETGLHDERNPGTFTSAHYGDLFADFSDDEYYRIPVEMLRVRFGANGIVFTDAGALHALDAGCGGGRFSHALRVLGFGRVLGIDLSEANVETARRRSGARVSDVGFQQDDVLNMSLPDGAFDFVFCNGVLHHTPDMAAGLSECRRVLRAGGHCYVTVMERPGGIVLDAIEIGRAVLGDVTRSYAGRVADVLGYRGFHRYNLLDHLFVPYNIRTTAEEFEDMLEAAGFGAWRRLPRGIPTDRCERLFRSGGADPDAVWKYGIGENAYLCSA